MNLVLVKPENIERIWQEAWEFLSPALERQETFSQENLLFGLLREFHQLWYVESDQKKKVFIVTEIVALPNCYKLVIRFAGGIEIADFLPLLDVMEMWARNKGITRMEVWGRKGWEKVLSPYNYSYDCTILYKDIHEVLH